MSLKLQALGVVCVLVSALLPMPAQFKTGGVLLGIALVIIGRLFGGSKE